MREVNFEMAAMVAWLKSIARPENGPIAIAELNERPEYSPAARGVFVGPDRIGDVVIWAKGCVDFQVLTEAEGGPEFFDRIDIERLDDPGLEALRKGFVQAMTESVPHDPDRRV